MRLLFFIILFSGTSFNSSGQEGLGLQGAIIIQNSENTSPVPGTIRWTGSDFEGWNGMVWISLTGGAIKDIDNNSYRIVTIGTQIWMAQNLRTTRCNDGTPIPLVTDQAAWTNLTTGGHTWPTDNFGNKISPPEYGALYNWYAVSECNICPVGWHVPTDSEWTTLIDYLDPGTVDPFADGVQSSIAGGKIKETGLAHWPVPNPGATNESGFTALPEGYRQGGGGYFGIGTEAYWWSTTEHTLNNDNSFAWFRTLFNNNTEIRRWAGDKGFGFSVRCVKD